MSNRRHRRHRRIAVTLGASVVAVGLLSSELLVIEYLVLRLRADPQYVWELASEEPRQDSAVDRALDRYLSGARAQQWLVGELWTHVVETPLSLALRGRAKVIRGRLVDRGDGSVVLTWVDEGGDTSQMVSSSDDARSHVVLRLLRRSRFNRVAPPGSDGWLVTARDTRPERTDADKDEASASDWPPSAGRGLDGHECIIEHAPRDR